MSTLFSCRQVPRLCALALVMWAVSAQGQTSQRGVPAVRAVPQPKAPAMVPGVAGFGTPRPAGLPSPTPKPEGLSSRFPAGVPSPTPNPAGLPAPTVPNLSSPGTRPGSPPIDAGVVPPTSVMGGAGYGGVPAVQHAVGTTPAPLTALQVAQSFLGADINRDGELTRAEAQRLTIMPYSFEEMDRDRDGVITRFEYEDGVR